MTADADLLRRYREGDVTAADEIYRQYTERLLALARTRLSAKLGRRVDADDIVQSTYRSFFVRARDNEFRDTNSSDLWPLLATITLRKLGRLAKRHRAAKRTIDRENIAPGGSPNPLLDLASREPASADVVAAAEEVHWLMSQIEPIQRQVVQMRLQGTTHEEIAATIERSERTVRRWLADAHELLRQRWSDEGASPRAIGGSPGNAERRSHGDTDAAAPLHHADYRLERLIGSGGMSKVYVARERRGSKQVAIKVLRKRLRRQSQAVEWFVREAQIVAEFDHPHIVRLHGLGRLPDGGYFIVMNFIDGQDLANRYMRERASPAAAAEIVATVAGAIQYAHDRGVVHRDLKPGNVLLDKKGHVFVTDFGFASLLNAPIPDGHVIAGTAGFMAPEQIDPQFGAICARSDIYGLGALLYMLLMGRPPFHGKSTSEILTMATAPASLRVGPKLTDEIPAPIREVCNTCLQLNPMRRYSTAREVASILTAQL